MGQISDRLRSGYGMLFAFWCPGCEELHHIPSGRGWTWDGNVESPTAQPSLLMRSGHFVPGWSAGSSCWCTYNAERRARNERETPFKCECCHLFVRAGELQFLPDCSHAFAGKTVPIPPLPPDHRDPA